MHKFLFYNKFIIFLYMFRALLCSKYVEDIEAYTTVQLKTLTKEDFQNCFRKWQERWDKGVRSEGEYFEVD